MNSENSGREITFFIQLLHQTADGYCVDPDVMLRIIDYVIEELRKEWQNNHPKEGQGENRI